jgi:hypothetical protein
MTRERFKIKITWVGNSLQPFKCEMMDFDRRNLNEIIKLLR